MAEITVKLFGVFRTDTRTASEVINVDTVADIFPELNKLIDKTYQANLEKDPELRRPDPIEFKDAIVYIGGDRCPKKRTPLKDGDEVWIMSPASGG